ncbi:MAG TPA: hypothetical protein VEL74_12025 [Thermoanaerobaculia bacterium]|nr:hypothetical protein [Thermoanaerobaculia bacterium]
MRKMLIALTLTLTAAAAASTTSAAAATKCPRNTYLVVCSSTLSICCPNGAACLCPPRES